MRTVRQVQSIAYGSAKVCGLATLLRGKASCYRRISFSAILLLILSGVSEPVLGKGPQS